MTRALLAVAVLAVLTGCATAIIIPRESDVAAARAVFPDATLGDLVRGRDAFVAHCAGCHQLPLPEKRAPAQWPALVDKMAADAKVNDTEKALIARYLVAASAHSRQAAADFAASR